MHTAKKLATQLGADAQLGFHLKEQTKRSVLLSRVSGPASPPEEPRVSSRILVLYLGITESDLPSEQRPKPFFPFQIFSPAGKVQNGCITLEFLTAFCSEGTPAGYATPMLRSTCIE